jgi:hypothetical protein
MPSSDDLVRAGVNFKVDWESRSSSSINRSRLEAPTHDVRNLRSGLSRRQRPANCAKRFGAMKLTTEIGMTSAHKKNTGARWEITVDGIPRSYRDDQRLAIEGAEYLKRANPGAEVTRRGCESIEVAIVIKGQPAGVTK